MVVLYWDYFNFLFFDLLDLPAEPFEPPVLFGLSLLSFTLYTTKPAKAKTPANANNVAVSMLISLLFFHLARVWGCFTGKFNPPVVLNIQYITGFIILSNFESGLSGHDMIYFIMMDFSALKFNARYFHDVLLD